MQGKRVLAVVAVAAAAAAFAPASAGAAASSSGSCVGQLASGEWDPGAKADFVQGLPKPRGALVSGFARSTDCSI